MKTRKLGKTNLEVNPIGLGCMGFSHAYGAAVDKNLAIKTIRAAYDEIGYNFFDTAECYTGTTADGSISNNEELVGEALKNIRDKVIIATKFGVSHNPDRSLNLDSSPQNIRRAIDGSLKRLQTDCVDLYYSVDNKSKYVFQELRIRLKHFKVYRNFKRRSNIISTELTRKLSLKKSRKLWRNLSKPEKFARGEFLRRMKNICAALTKFVP